MKRIIKRLVFIISFSFILCLGIVFFHVQQWSTQAEGHLPPKTAVILHAVNNNLVHFDMKIPNFITKKSGVPTMTREDIAIPVSDGSFIPARIYKPKGEGPFPIVMYYHGGAFLEGYGNIETHDNITRYLAGRTKSIVVSVGYRVAPKHVFPTAIEDSYDALVWTVSQAEQWNADPSKVAVVGDSAGGNIATVIALMARDRGGPDLAAQVLYYPLTTFREYHFESREKYDRGYYFLSRRVMERARDLYTPEETMWLSPYTSPLDAENVADLPATFMITAEFDPLRDEGEAYALRLAAAGVPVEAYRYQGVMHAFISFYEVMYRGKDGLNRSISFLNRAFHDDVNVENYSLQIVAIPYDRSNIQDHIEAYVFAGALLSKQAYDVVINSNFIKLSH